MKADTSERVRTLFAEALEVSPSRRKAFLIERCAGDSEVRRRVETLLAHDEQAEGFLEPPDRRAGNPEHVALPTGARLGQYEILGALGSGGMGTVYRAAGPQGTVALKVVHPHLLAAPGFFKRFLQEAEIGRAVSHPNVVRCFDADAIAYEGRQQNYLVMEYVSGRTLRDLLDDMQLVPEELCRHAGMKVAQGLAAIHAAGAVHRDLKPENVLITPEHEVKIMDLGVARLVDAAIRLSRSGAFVGSVLYAAPEQFRAKGGPLDGRADLFSLGVILYELACGAHPHPGEDFARVLARVLDEEPRRLGERNPQLSPFFEEVVHVLLRKDPQQRIGSARELAGILGGGEESSWWGRRARALRVQTRRPLRRIRIPRETAVYGREDELTRLEARYEAARSGEGRVVLLEGEAGIGKTRLVDELLRRLGERGEDPNFLFGSYPPSGAAAARGGLSTAFREHFGEAGAAEWLERTPRLVPSFDAVLRGEPAPEDALALTRESLATCFVHALRNLAAERPTILLVDDLHFAPEDARDLFLALALAVPGHRVLLIGTTRPGLPDSWLARLTRLEHAEHEVLPRLGPKDLALLLKDSFRSERLAEELGYKIALKSDGNPFFVFEIIRGLREGQFITQQHDGTWISTRVIEEIQIPSSVLDLVNARVADLAAEERNLLDVASCLGFEFDPGLAGDVLGMARIPSLQAFAAVEKRHRLVRSAGRHYVFDHHQVQEALYGSLNDQLREEYHAAIAEGLEDAAGAADKQLEELDGGLCVEICEHFLRGARGERSLRYLGVALRHLTAGYVNEQGIALAERALAPPGLLEGALRAKVLLQKNVHHDLLGHRAAQELVLEEACALAEATEDAALLATAARARGALLLDTGRPGEARSYFERAFLASQEVGDRLGEADAANALGMVFGSLGRTGESRVHYERALSLYQEVGDRGGVAWATTNLGLVSHQLGQHDEARTQHQRALAIFSEIGNRQGEAVATSNFALVCQSLGSHDAALAHYERALAILREVGDRFRVAYVTYNLGSTLQTLGRAEGARAYFERALAIFREVGGRSGEAGATVGLGIGSHSRGLYDQARSHYERALAIYREAGDRSGEAITTGNLGSIWVGLGARDRAREALEDSLSSCREIGIRQSKGFALLALARLADGEGRVEEARQLAHDSLGLGREIGHGVGVADALTFLGSLELRAGRIEESRAALEEALGLCREQGREAEVALALALRSCLPGGDPDAAQKALEKAGESEDSIESRFHLWQATRKHEHLAEAKRLLDYRVEHAPEEYLESMLKNVRLNREIMEAWAEHGEKAVGEGEAE